jgi:hypothetical protein
LGTLTSNKFGHVEGGVIVLETLTCRARLLMHFQNLSARTWVMENGFVYSTPVGRKEGDIQGGTFDCKLQRANVEVVDRGKVDTVQHVDMEQPDESRDSLFMVNSQVLFALLNADCCLILGHSERDNTAFERIRIS